MPDDKPSVTNSLINLGDVSKPANTLIEKIAEATGILFEPFRITRAATAEGQAKIIHAKADAQVALINAESQRELSAREQRAVRRMLAEQSREQENIETV